MLGITRAQLTVTQKQNYSFCHFAALNVILWAQKTRTSKGNNVIVNVTEMWIWRSAKLNPLIMYSGEYSQSKLMSTYFDF